ncbi:diacylglycerol kinase family protein [Cryobacterium sp. PH31-AA6]|uniref:diacylglycerol/lipid kinase family protein n=1 Tax=Cryobacterium sp. PH31-AA6 TaxID=3046205 RepID=UPI0024B928A9|nr:diacylglycerol kinase family protein [Cryobacterium sp. PH31-AA6]MDJ0324716.1 diacylglycerol kinase family protein [Cryobacterium sp. PH31-AA6]
MTPKNPVAAPHTHTAAVIYNPIKVDLDAIKAAVATEEAAAGWRATQFFPTSVDDPGQGAAQEALDAGVDLVIVAGGDGTVRAVAEIVHESAASLALLPSGTGNLFARNLELTLDDVEDAIRTAFTGVKRPVDLGLIEIRHGDGSLTKHAFLVMAGLGLDAKMLANTDEELKKKVGWLAYVSAIVKALLDKSELRVRYRLDGGRVKSVRAHTIIIGNCGSLQANVLLLPDAAVDDGFFDIAVLRPDGPFGWVQIAAKVFWENGVLRRTKLGSKVPTKDVHALNYVKAAEITMRLSGAEEIELDGDGLGDATAIKARLKPAGLNVMVPR